MNGPKQTHFLGFFYASDLGDVLFFVSSIQNILDEHPWQDGSASGSSTACQAIACDTALSVTGVATWWAYIPNPEVLENQTPEKWFWREILAKWP